MEKIKEKTRETPRNRKPNSKRVLPTGLVHRNRRRELRRSEPLDLAQFDPNDLRDKVFRALSHLTADDCAAVRGRILGALRQGGVDLANCLLLLGIIARTPDEMTPLEVAKLLRYVRINSPGAMGFLGVEIGQLFERGEAANPSGRPLHKAA